MNTAAMLATLLQHQQLESIKKYFEEKNALNKENAVKLPDKTTVKNYRRFVINIPETELYYFDQAAYTKAQARGKKDAVIFLTIFAILLIIFLVVSFRISIIQ